MLEILGLDEICEAVYRAVLAYPQVELAELGERLRISGVKLRQALDQLSELALIRPIAGQPSHFRAVNPELGIQTVIAQQEERLATEQRRIEQIRRTAAQLSADFTATRLDKRIEGVERLDGIEEIRDRIALLVRDVRVEIMAFAPGGAQSEASMEAAKPQDQQVLERGVRMRTLYLDSVRHNPATLSYAKWLSGLGGEVRTTPSLPVRMMVLDHGTAIVPVDGGDSSAGALVLSGCGTVTALSALFESIWEQSVPLGQPASRERDEHDLTPQEAEALRLLGQGLTDEAVAKRLGVSPRTARRIAADLLEKLGARSRFQAGAKAVSRGWLTGAE
ncbi:MULTISPECIES: LuxR family transcriptional regulator [unclassified Streptomyces]|uniref:helix-turn-helix transcriptional regulator n=1 Tax=unclassified Streptomyces TaxID=2593676 RepID=UPI0015E19A4D|nr:LuxR family transcriptional regulator [Streptomyces sp. SM10]